MHENMNRIYEDVAWFIEKYDYKIKMPTGKIPRMRSSAVCRSFAEVIHHFHHMFSKIKSPGILPAV